MTEINDLYGDVEQAVKPVVLSHAMRLARAGIGMTMDEALQECRVALWRALHGYDFDKSNGGIHRFVDKVLRNNALSIIYANTTMPRMPHTVYSEGGKTKVVKHRLLSLDGLPSDDDRPSFEPPGCEADPEQQVLDDEAASKRRKLVMRLYNKLGPRERKVYDLKCRPTEAFMVYLRNIGLDEPTHTAIAKYIGVSKNSVDYSAHIIRDTFTKLAEKEFTELIQDHIDNGSWPMIHVSREPGPDHDFIRQIIAERNLDPRPTGSRDIEKKGDIGREITPYPWGVVIVLRRGEQFRTLVVEGRFNKITGSVFGSVEGTHKRIPDVVPWYDQLSKELAR